MKVIMIGCSVMLISSVATAATDDCRASQSVKAVAELLSKAFNGATIECDDGSSFSAKNVFRCDGNRYVEIKDPTNLTTLPDGKVVYVLNELSERGGRVTLTEVSYGSHADFVNHKEPVKTDDAEFVTLSNKSFMFYSNEAPSVDGWISSTWYLVGDEPVQGYKLYADRMFACKAK